MAEVALTTGIALTQSPLPRPGACRGGGHRHGGSLIRIGYGPSLALTSACGDRLEPAVSTLTAVIRGCGPDQRVARGAGRWRGAWLLLGGRTTPGGRAGRAADVLGSALDGLGTRHRGPARP